MSIKFRWNRIENLIKTLDIEIKNDSKDHDLNAYFQVKCNIADEPLECVLKYENITLIDEKIIDETVNFYLTDNEKNMIGIVSASCIYKQSIDPIEPSRTTIPSVTFPVVACTGIFKSFKNGFIIIQFTDDGNRIARLYA